MQVDRVLCNSLVLKRVGCYKMNPPRWMVPFLLLYHAVMQLGTLVNTSTMLFRTSSHQNHEPNESLYKIPSLKYSS